MTTNDRSLLAVLKESVNDFMEDDCTTMAAALSYYTVFSLPPLLVLLLMLLGAILDPQDVQGTMERQLSSLMGPTGAEQVRTILANADRPGSGSVIATVLGVIGLLLGATGVFGQLQSALDKVWEVAPDPSQGVKSFMLKRVFSLGMVLGIAFVLLVSLVLSAAISAFGDSLARFLPAWLSEPFLIGLDLAFSIGVITLLFGAILKVLPDARVDWHDVWVGALFTAVLFTIGKVLLGLYLGNSNPGQAFGAAGALALLLVWIYYTSMIVLFGAEFTEAWAKRRGHGVVPQRGAVRVIREIRRERPSGARPVESR
ncbi:MAG: YihY/virulence factor BrkB family protein [Gemmatimonadales bacterium]